MGDPAGVGPQVLVQALDQLPDLTDTHQITLFGSLPDLDLAAELTNCGFDRNRFRVVDPAAASSIAAVPGSPTDEGGRAQLAYIDAASSQILEGQATALVTGPVSKISICRAGAEHFSGHTEHLARSAGVPVDDVTMMFAGPRLRVALVTTHHPLRDVSSLLTTERLVRTIRRVDDALRNWWSLPKPRIVVLGLNPHAGEEGLLGAEEEAVIAPAVELLRKSKQPFDAELTGPIPSEVGLRGVWEGRFDCAVAHYHDQATIPCKLLEMGKSVNVTLGLPFLRTSVDHGVAYDVAAAGAADPGSMIAALQLAARLTR